MTIDILLECDKMLDMSEKYSKMYILVKRSLPSHKVVAVAHGVLMAYLKYQDDPGVQDWVKNSFRKVICEVTDQEFEAAKCESNYVIVTESALKDKEVALAFKPRLDWPQEFKFYPLMRV